MSFPRYERYKDSGVEWLGEVPEGWEVKRLKHNFRLLTEKTDRRKNPVALENIESWSGRFIETETEFQGEGVAFDAGDILFGKLRPYLAKARLADQSGEAVGDFHVIRPLTGVAGRFAIYQILNQDFISIVDGSTFGAKMPRVSWDFMSNMMQAIPPLPEQQTIATFLDRETGKIDELVAEQERLIALLKEKRQATISHAVAKGLNPDAPLKDSGIEWLGEVPKGWEVSRLKYLVSICGRIGFRGYAAEDLVIEGEGALALGGANLTNFGSLDLSKRTYLSWQKYEESPEIMVSVNDLLIGQRGTCGNVVIVDRDIGPATINPSLVLLKQSQLHSSFLCYWLMGGLIKSVFDSYLSSTAVPMLTQQQIGNVPVLVPSRNEQSAIVAFLDSETAKIDTLTGEAQQAISLLKERRSALISAAVTGKIDVRNLST